MIVYELASEVSTGWFLSIGQAGERATELELEAFEIYRLTLSAGYEEPELAWVLRHRDAQVLKRERVLGFPILTGLLLPL